MTKNYGSKTSMKKLMKKKIVKKTNMTTNDQQPNNDTTEKWKNVPEFPNYSVSNTGKIKNNKLNQERKLQLKMGYHYCKLIYGENEKNFRVHRLVAQLFVPNPDRKKNKIVNHIDGNKLNNNSKNLEWTTIKGNNQHAIDNELTTVTKRRVAQYVGDDLYAEYASLKEAEKATGIHISRIVETCQGKREEYDGYVFRYMDKNPNEKEIDPAKEGFKKIKTFPNYWVNNKGELYSGTWKRIMKQNKHRTGCLQVQFCKKDKKKRTVKKTVLVHNIVASYFLKNKPENSNAVRHKDGDRTNNNVNNLEWCHINACNADFTI